MRVESIYLRPEVGARFSEITLALRAHIGVELHDHDIETSFARTHVVETGNPGGPPLVVLHGGGTNGIFGLYFLRHLLPKYHIYAIDTPGHPGASECVFIDPRNDDNGHWLREVVENLGLVTANYVGISWGGFLLQRLAAVAPECIEKAVFVVPAGLVVPPTLPMVFGFLLPRMLCRWTGNMKYLQGFINKLFTDTDDPMIREYFEVYFRDVRADMRPMKRAQPEEMAGFTAPKLVLAAEEDIFFPASAMGKRCRAVFSGPVDFRILPGSKHSPSMEEGRLTELSGMIDGFLQV